MEPETVRRPRVRTVPRPEASVRPTGHPQPGPGLWRRLDDREPAVRPRVRVRGGVRARTRLGRGRVPGRGGVVSRLWRLSRQPGDDRRRDVSHLPSGRGGGSLDAGPGQRAPAGDERRPRPRRAGRGVQARGAGPLYRLQGLSAELSERRRPRADEGRGDPRPPPAGGRQPAGPAVRPRPRTLPGRLRAGAAVEPREPAARGRSPAGGRRRGERARPATLCPRVAARVVRRPRLPRVLRRRRAPCPAVPGHLLDVQRTHGGAGGRPHPGGRRRPGPAPRHHRQRSPAVLEGVSRPGPPARRDERRDTRPAGRARLGRRRRRALRRRHVPGRVPRPLSR